LNIYALILGLLHTWGYPYTRKRATQWQIHRVPQVPRSRPEVSNVMIKGHVPEFSQNIFY